MKAGAGRILTALPHQEAHSNNRPGSQLNTIARYLLPQDVCLDFEVADKNALFEAIGHHMQREHGLPQHQIAHCLSRREQAGGTGVGEGVAIPHARIEGLGPIRAAYVRLVTPISFGAADGRPVSDVVVLLVPYPAADEHLQLLAETTRMFSDARFRASLHASRDPQEVARLFSQWPQSLLEKSVPARDRA